MSGVLRSRRPLPLKLNQSLLELLLCLAAVLRHKSSTLLTRVFQTENKIFQNITSFSIFVHFLKVDLWWYCRFSLLVTVSIMIPSKGILYPHLLRKSGPHGWSRKHGTGRKPASTTPRTRTPSSGFFVAGAERALTRSLLTRYINSFFTPICILFE